MVLSVRSFNYNISVDTYDKCVVGPRLTGPGLCDDLLGSRGARSSILRGRGGSRGRGRAARGGSAGRRRGALGRRRGVRGVGRLVRHLHEQALVVRQVEVHLVRVLLPLVGVPAGSALLHRLVVLWRGRRSHVQVDVAAAVAAATLLLGELQEGPGKEGKKSLFSVAFNTYKDTVDLLVGLRLLGGVGLDLGLGLLLLFFGLLLRYRFLSVGSLTSFCLSLSAVLLRRFLAVTGEGRFGSSGWLICIFLLLLRRPRTIGKFSVAR